MDQFGEYLLHRVIGEGGMGRVYAAEERLSRRPVAVKLLKRELGRIARVRELFINEMEILARLEHPNIVRSLASVEVDDQLAVVLEYVDGCTLRELLDERGALTPTEATHVVACVAGALVAAHGHAPPVVHRDLKPENIMVATTGAVKVMDFGIAKLLDRVDQTNTRNLGTLLYMSPEQIDADSIDHRSDLYALGLVFYELLCGKPPFMADSPRELLNLQCTAAPPPLAEGILEALPPDIEALLFSMLDKDPDRRPQSAKHVAERLSPVAANSRPPASKRSGSDTMPMARPRTWHPEAAKAAWLARFNLAEDTEAAALGPSLTVAQQPLVDPLTKRASPRRAVARVAVTQADEPELSTQLSVAIIGLLMVLAGLVTYWLRAP